MESITDHKLKCPECGLVTAVCDAVHDGEMQRNGFEFESDGSLGCPFCFYVKKETVFLKEV